MHRAGHKDRVRPRPDCARPQPLDSAGRAASVRQARRRDDRLAHGDARRRRQAAGLHARHAPARPRARTVPRPDVRRGRQCDGRLPQPLGTHPLHRHGVRRRHQHPEAPLRGDRERIHQAGVGAIHGDAPVPRVRGQASQARKPRRDGGGQDHRGGHGDEHRGRRRAGSPTWRRNSRPASAQSPSASSRRCARG
jgi:hypothetical protein